jgi:hypothetical protein
VRPASWRRAERLHTGARRADMAIPTARRPDVLAQTICAHLLARSAYSQGARDRPDLARQRDLRSVGVASSVGRARRCGRGHGGRCPLRDEWGRRLAFGVRAGGPHPMVWVPAWITNQDLEDLVTQPVRGPLFERLSSFATSVSYDQRGTGLSDPVSLTDLPTLEGWTDDLHAGGSRRPGARVHLHQPRPRGAK